MTELQWKCVENFKTDFKSKIATWNQFKTILASLQKQAAQKAKTPEYQIETPIVYNSAIDEITPKDEIKLIVIGDNPGKNEQLAKNQKYLVGQAGKIAEGFFRRNAELEIDFRKNVIILNKTPIHSAKTAQLKTIAKTGTAQIEQLILESQLWMAQATANLLKNLNKYGKTQTQLWLVGYSELKPNGIFGAYKEELKKSCDKQNWQNVMVFQHFSMNCFTKDLNSFKNANPQKTLKEALFELGTKHRKEIFSE